MYAGREFYTERMIDECIGVFDRSSKEEWPLKVKNVELTGRPFLRMSFVKDDVMKRSEGEHPFSHLRGVPRRDDDKVRTGARLP